MAAALPHPDDTSASGTAPSRKRLIVCADDYAFTPGVSRAIRELIAARRISATSVMAAAPDWPAEAAALKAIAGDADIGLHVTLTDHVPLGPMPRLAPDGRFPRMPDLYRAGLLRRLPLDEIGAEIARQADRFIQHYGAPPAHIDGHHHVHQLPGIRDIIVETARRLGVGRTWVRAGHEAPSLVWRRGVASSKALVIGALGRGVAARARAAGVPVNRGFSGAYDFLADPRPAAELFRRFVTGAADNALVMCHPGHSDATLAQLDVMIAARDAEAAYLMSAAWPALLRAENFELGPLRRP